MYSKNVQGLGVEVSWAEGETKQFSDNPRVIWITNDTLASMKVQHQALYIFYVQPWQKKNIHH
jgi:hypothetical protein